MKVKALVDAAADAKISDEVVVKVGDEYLPVTAVQTRVGAICLETKEE